MRDLIDRQAAIEAIRASAQKYTGFMEMEMYTDDDAVEAIINLPSAQQWIPVSESLPGYGEGVIANFRNEQIGRDRIGVSYCYVQKEGFFSDVPFEYKVVAWMPLPMPWRGEEDE